MHTRRAFVSASAAALALPGCSRRRATADLSFWAMSYEGDYAPHLTTGFTRATGLSVDVQSLPWTAAHEKLLTAFAGGTLPDVLMLPNGWVAEFALIGAIAPLPATPADLFAGVIDSVLHGGRPYAIPWSLAPQMQFYRRDLVEAAGHATPPTNWSDWREMGIRLKRDRTVDYPYLLYLNWWDALFTFATQAGAAMLRASDTRGNFATPEFRAALLFYKSLFDLGLAPRALSTEIEDPVGAFAQGLFAIYPYGPQLMLDLRRRAAEIAPERWGIARMPGPDGPGPATSVSASIAVSAHTQRPDEAWRLAHHLTSVASELRFQRMIGTLPARRSAWRAPQLAQPLLAPYADQVRAIAHDPNIVEWERIRIEVQLVAERVVRGETTVDDGLAEMNARVDRLLERRRARIAAGRVA